MVKKIVIGLGVLVIAFLGYVAMQPAKIHLERSILILAAPEVVFPHINNLEKANAWNPWLKVDPNVKVTYEGPIEGVGAAYHWVGDSNIGAGSGTIVESVANHKVVLRMDFKQPMAATHPATYTILPDGTQSRVTWSFEGENGFIGRLFTVVFNMNKMMENKFDEGLNSLKNIIESEAKKD